MNKLQKNISGQSGEYAVASELSRLGLIATTFTRNMPDFDILATNSNKMIKIQVKTGWCKKNYSWRLGKKCENIFADDFYYAFVNLNELKESIEYWLIPSELVAKTIKESHQIWLSSPGKKGQKHNDNPTRGFSIKQVNYAPKWLDFKLIDSYKNNLSAIKK